MKKSVVAGLLLATVCATAAMAGVIEDRQAIMKSFGGTGRTLGGMANGTTPYDKAVADAQLQIIVDGSAKLPALFPAGSDQSTDAVKTAALPAVWSDSASFAAAAAKINADAKAAMGATDAATFKVAYAAVQGDCGGCHRTFRAAPQRGGAPGGAPGGGAGRGPAQ